KGFESSLCNRYLYRCKGGVAVVAQRCPERMKKGWNRLRVCSTFSAGELMKSNRLQRGGKLMLIVFATAFAVVSSGVTATQNQSPAKNGRNLSADPQGAQRFDMLVREDIFAGLAGDTARFDKAMKFIEETLAKNPKHAQAMVWHGGGVLTRGGGAVRKGEKEQGGRVGEEGMGGKKTAGAAQAGKEGGGDPTGVGLP